MILLTLNMNFLTLETERLILKRLTPTDLNYIFENYTEFEIRQLLGHETDADFSKEKNKFEKGYTTYNRSFEFFQMIDKLSSLIIGGCGFHNWYPDHRRAELGYSITKESFKRQGLMTEALKVIIEHGFSSMQLHRIEALVGTRNLPSLRLMERLSFEKEGVLKQHYFIDGIYEDSAIFGKLRFSGETDKG